MGLTVIMCVVSGYGLYSWRGILGLVPAWVEVISRPDVLDDVDVNQVY